MQAAVVGVAESGENHHPAVGATIGVDVLEGHQVRRVGDVKLAGVPGQPHRKHQLFGKHPRTLETPVTVAVFQHADAATARLRSQFVVKIATGRFGDEKASALIKGGEHRETNGRRACGQCDTEPGRSLQLQA